MPKEDTIQYWEEKIKESGGDKLWLPETFKKEAQEIEQSRKEFNKFLAEVAEKEISLNVRTQNLWLEIRKYLAQNGRPDIWLKEIGLDKDAADNGYYIINIWSNERR